MGNPLLLRRGLHVLLLLGLAVLAWQTVASGLALAVRGSNASLALRLAPNNALALAAWARAAVAQKPAAAEEAARGALTRNPTSASAAGVLSMTRHAAGDTAASRRFLAYSQSLSRRDLPTQLWAIEVAVQRNDIKAALYHYDISLRVGRSSANLLFPILVGASADPAIRVPLAKMLATGVPWKDSFLDYMSAQTKDIGAATQLVSDIYTNGGQVTAGPMRVIVQRLMEAGSFESAWTLYGRAYPARAGALVRNGKFSEVPELPSLFDWNVEELGEARAELHGGEQGELRFEARSGAGGIVARQRLALSPDRYVLAFDVRVPDGASSGDSMIEMFCEPAKARLAQVRLAGTNARRAVIISVDPTCRSQSLELRLDAGASETPIEGVLDNVSLAKVGARAALQ